MGDETAVVNASFRSELNLQPGKVYVFKDMIAKVAHEHILIRPGRESEIKSAERNAERKIGAVNTRLNISRKSYVVAN